MREIYLCNELMQTQALLRSKVNAFIGASVDICVKTRTINSLAYQSPIPPYGI